MAAYVKQYVVISSMAEIQVDLKLKNIFLAV